MNNGSQAIWTAAVIPVWSAPPDLRDNSPMPDDSPDQRGSRLRKHADYQCVYKESRKHFSPSMSFFFRKRGVDLAGNSAISAPRVGLTAGKVLGKAVDRNRIKRRMREAVRMNLARLPQSVDVVLHPRKSVIDMEFGKLSDEVARVFSTVSSHIEKPPAGAGKRSSAAADKRSSGNSPARKHGAQR
ncbi:ribonuclease P protein component [Silvibacterium bohemicum]|uniref:Ribonuclease P protein component n=1 Tax=Silvibacterium bohemicum TaxID=1577686 RepID=A0A841K626_9BACT|nr:ribonuclease P protein component [Silvibacterium bohemicum]MBB6145714.1 ribonuclease P protein component [Silvibacterium bohemicum]